MKAVLALVAIALLLMASAAYATPNPCYPSYRQMGITCPSAAVPVQSAVKAEPGKTAVKGEAYQGCPSTTMTPAHSSAMKKEAAKGTAVAGEAYQVGPSAKLDIGRMLDELYPVSNRPGVPPVFNF